MEMNLTKANAIPVIFLDRDGVINVQAAPHQYITQWASFKYLPGVYDAMRLLKQEGYRVIIVSNQRCVARGMATEQEINALHAQLISDIAAHGGRIDAIYYCPHDISDHCDCRKPKPGLLERAEQDMRVNIGPVDRSMSWMIGDSDSDVQAGISFGVNTVRILKERTLEVPPLISPGDGLFHINASSLLDAVRTIMEVRAA